MKSLPPDPVRGDAIASGRGVGSVAGRGHGGQGASAPGAENTHVEADDRKMMRHGAMRAGTVTLSDRVDDALVLIAIAERESD